MLEKLLEGTSSAVGLISPEQLPGSSFQLRVLTVQTGSFQASKDHTSDTACPE